MVIICEQCGSKYKVDTSKLKGRKGKAKCKFCSASIVVEAQEKAVTDPLPLQESMKQENTEAVDEYASILPDRRFGLRGKIFVLIFAIPLILIGFSSIVFLNKLETISSALTGESYQMAESFAQQIIERESGYVATDLRKYLDGYPGVSMQSLSDDDDFTGRAVQKIGNAGQTMLVSHDGTTGKLVTVANFQKELIGEEFLKGIGQNFNGQDLARLKKQLDIAVQDKQQTSLLYMKDDGSKGVYVFSPVPSTPYLVVTVADINDYIQPAQTLQVHADKLGKDTAQIVLLSLIITIVVVATIAILYGSGLAVNIRNLTEATERISMGDMTVDVSVKTRDELEDLADSISRLQSSIQISLRRLNKQKYC